ncbi:MAG: histidine kinase dimerization/phospho-acceptor domain-containing protein, partial [Cyanobacteria bacterium P01_A01_bin.17]
MWVVPTMGEVVAMQEPEAALVASAAAEKEWRVAIATMTQLLSQCVQQDLDSADVCPMQGFILSGPIPLFNEPNRLGDLQSLVFTADKSAPLQLPPSHQALKNSSETTCQSVPLLPADPLSHEKFCLIQTSAFCWLAVLRHHSEGMQFQFSFNPETIEQALTALRSRIQLTRPHQIAAFDVLTTQFPVLTPDYRIPLQFSRHLLHTALQAPFSPRQGFESQVEQQQAAPEKEKARPEVELLQAIAHEVRTPLTTIQTFTRLLLKRSDLPGEVLQRLESIQRE